MPPLIAATKWRNGEAERPAFCCSQAQASYSATAPPVMEAVRVPPSACSTSQSMVTCHSPMAAMSTQARSERPIRRWISCVRPPTLSRSRRLRVLVARGSIEYSAVTHPAPFPFRQPGTPCSTDAVQSTRVRPTLTRHEPSAYSAAPRSRRSGRGCSGARPSFLTIPSPIFRPLANALQDRRGGAAGDERDHLHPPAGRLHLVGADDGVARVV